MQDKKYHVQPQNARKIWRWIHQYGGVAHWESVNLSNPGKFWTTPSKMEDGTPPPKPNWQAGNKPTSVTTDPNDVVVDIPWMVAHFPVKTRVGAQGYYIKLTAESSDKLRRTCRWAAETYDTEPWYDFDYENQEAIVYVAEKEIPLPVWIKENGADEPTKGDDNDSNAKEE